MIFVANIGILLEVKLIIAKKSLPTSFLFLSTNDSISGWTILHISLQASSVIFLSLYVSKVLSHNTGLSSIYDISNSGSTSEFPKVMAGNIKEVRTQRNVNYDWLP
jgi:hypothetical protein